MTINHLSNFLSVLHAGLKTHKSFIKYSSGTLRLETQLATILKKEGLIYGFEVVKLKPKKGTTIKKSRIALFLKKGVIKRISVFTRPSRRLSIRKEYLSQRIKENPRTVFVISLPGGLRYFKLRQVMLARLCREYKVRLKVKRKRFARYEKLPENIAGTLVCAFWY